MKNITLSSNIINDSYTEYVYDHFDIQNRERVVNEVPYFELPNEKWNIGLIYGSSGSGKTTILNKLRKQKDIEPFSIFDNNKALISNFDHLSEHQAGRVLSSVGLSSVPSWLKPYDVLSNGEKFRADMAMRISKAKDICFIDEFTSIVDRDVAKATSNAVGKWIRRDHKQVVFASCHKDIIPWLQPDWIFDVEKGEMLKKKEHEKPEIKLDIYEGHYDSWELFKKHHYLNNNLNKTSRIYLAYWNGKLTAMVAVITFPNGYIEHGMRGTRTVVLPKFQGLGIGSKFSDYIAGSYRNGGYRYFTKTVSPALGIYRNNSDDWRGTSKNGKVRKDIKGRNRKWRGLERKSYCHEYVGDKGDKDILLHEIKN